jgi:hypothetical protein
MSHFDDLTPYSYFHPEEEAPGTVNIGWLDGWHPFPTGETSEAFRSRLQWLCRNRVKRTRGTYACDFCEGRNKPAGSAEIRVPGQGRVYAAPELVYHYVAVHDYLPPEEFIEAVLQCDEAEGPD